MSKYNYFDDDYDIDNDKEKSIDPKEILDAVRAFSLKSERKIKDIAHNVAENNPIDRIPKSKRLVICLVSFIVIILIIIGLVFGFVHTINKENKKVADFNSNAGKICSQYAGEYGNCSYQAMKSKYSVDGYMMTGICYARQMDFDNDATSELLLCYNDGGIYYVEVWGFDHNNKFVNLFHEKANQTNDKKDGAWITLYYRSNKYYIGVHNEDLSEVDLYSMKNAKFEKKSSCIYDIKTEGFYIKEKDCSSDFERIKLSVLKEASASRTAEFVADIIDGFGSYAVDAEAKTNGDNDKRNRAYYSVVQDYTQKYGNAKYVEKDGLAYIDGLAVVKLVDFDGDGSEELMLIYRRTIRMHSQQDTENYILIAKDKYFCDIYKFNGQKALLVYENEGLSQKLNNKDDVYYVLKAQDKKNYFCTNTFYSENYGRRVSATSKTYLFNGESFVQESKSHYEDNYGYSRYYIDDQQVSKTTFDEKGYTVALFNGEDSYDDQIFKVGYVQRKSADAGNMSAQVDQTENTIKQLN